MVKYNDISGGFREKVCKKLVYNPVCDRVYDVRSLHCGAMNYSNNQVNLVLL